MLAIYKVATSSFGEENRPIPHTTIEIKILLSKLVNIFCVLQTSKGNHGIVKFTFAKEKL
jgi:hypothetical protein